MRILRLVLLPLAALLVGGCYAPSVPGGSYRCGVGDACPSGLSCECGLCVSDPSQAACSFTIALASGQNAVEVKEHEKFDVVVTALGKAGRPATHFGGDVTLSSTWGDVCVGTAGCVGAHDLVHLDGGAAHATVQLNRETNEPQTAILRATFAGNVGSSGLAKIVVRPPPAVRDAKAISGSLAGTSTYGFAKAVTGYPYVIKDATGWKLYFVGGERHDGTVTTAVGLATSMDGVSWIPPAASLFTPTVDGTGKVETTTEVGGVGAYVSSAGISLFFGRGAQASSSFGYGTIQRADAPGANGPFDPAALPAAIELVGCPSCLGMDFPTVIRDPAPSLSGGGADSAVMFFSAEQPLTSSANESLGLSVLRAVALDGRTFAVDPSPAIESTAAERTVVSPRILVDGTTYKMWYTFAPDPTPNGGAAADANNPCAAINIALSSFNAKLSWKIGYATSSDGYYWVRSDANATAPVLEATAVGQDAKASLLLGSVFPADGVDASNGIALYYSPVRPIFGLCAPDGMGRAVRP